MPVIDISRARDATERNNLLAINEYINNRENNRFFAPGAFAVDAASTTGGGTTAPDPSSISGLLLWLKADAGVYNDAGVTLATNGQTVQQWNDQSGNGNHASQATAGLRPTYVTGVQNGLSAVRFAGDGMQVASLAISTFAAVVIFRSSGAAGVIYEQSADINANDGILLFGGTGSSIAVRKSATFSTRNINATWGIGDEWFSVCHWYGDGGGHPNHHVAIANAWLGYATGTGNNPGTGTTTAALNIGARNNGASLNLTGDIAELFIHSPAPTMTQAKTLVQYASNRWNIP